MGEVQMKKVCVMGMGYIGLPTASLLAIKGFKVLGVDCLKEVVNTINKGKVHIYEPDLDVMVKSAVNSGNLIAATTPEDADVFIIAVPTPFKDNHVPDLSYVEKATKAIAGVLKPGDLIILESTSPVGTTESIAKWVAEVRTDLDVYGDSADKVYFAHCPERVLPGQILKELVDNDRIVGGLNKESARKALQFYQKFVHGKILITNSRTAELAKLVENSFRDVNIAFANELSMICDKLDINVWELIELANRHPRVNILNPGPGVGGHCIAVDPWFIVDAFPNDARIIRTAREVNDSKPEFVIDKIKAKAVRFKNPVIAFLGLAFKANVDDLRESPALEIVKRMAKENIGTLLVSEPHLQQLPDGMDAKTFEFVTSGEAISRADIVVLLVDHNAFSELDKEQLKEKVIIDTRGFWR